MIDCHALKKKKARPSIEMERSSHEDCTFTLWVTMYVSCGGKGSEPTGRYRHQNIEEWERHKGYKQLIALPLIGRELWEAENNWIGCWVREQGLQWTMFCMIHRQNKHKGVEGWSGWNADWLPPCQSRLVDTNLGAHSTGICGVNSCTVWKGETLNDWPAGILDMRLDGSVVPYATNYHVRVAVPTYRDFCSIRGRSLTWEGLVSPYDPTHRRVILDQSGMTAETKTSLTESCKKKKILAGEKSWGLKGTVQVKYMVRAHDVQR